MPLPKLRLLKYIIRAIRARLLPEAQIREWPGAESFRMENWEFHQSSVQQAVPVEEVSPKADEEEPLLVKYECDLGYRRPFYFGFGDVPFPITNMFKNNQEPTSSPEAAAVAVVHTSDGFVGVAFTGEHPMVEFHSLH